MDEVETMDKVDINYPLYFVNFKFVGTIILIMNPSVKLPFLYFVRRFTEFIIPIVFLVGIFSGALNSTFPILVAIVVMIIIKPWHLGLFWSIEIFALLNVPTSFILLVSKKARKTDEENYQKEKLRVKLINA